MSDPDGAPAARARQGFCPVCGTGPWRNLPIHAARKHGVGRKALRELVDVPWSESLTDPDLSRLLAERARDRDQASRMHAAPRNNTGEVSPAGRRGRARSASLSADVRAKIPEADHAAILARIDRGETRRSIARSYGVTPSAMTQYLNKPRSEGERP